jgi:hypothetical protein
MLHRSIHRSLVPMALVAVACHDGAGPAAEAGNVEVIMDAAVVETDAAVVVNGERRLTMPSNHKALWLDRFLHYEFGGFPELEYPQNTRASEAWRLQLTHEKDQVTRNDSTIFSFVDHGDAAVEESAVEKLTSLPYVPPGVAVRFENWVRYLATSYSHVTWLDGTPTTFYHTQYHDRLVAGERITLTTTGSADVNAVTATVSASPIATLIELRNGEAVELDAATPPVLRVNSALILGFDRPLDRERAYLLFIPWPNQGGGAKRAFIQPRAATDRTVIPASVLADMVATASTSRVAYRVVIEEFAWKPDAFTGTFSSGESFSLPFVQEGETTLHVYLER